MVGHVSVVSVTISSFSLPIVSFQCSAAYIFRETKMMDIPNFLPPTPQPPSAQDDPFFPVDEVKFTYLKSKHFNFNLPKAIIFSFISKPQSFCDPENEGLGGEPQTYLVDYPVIDT